MTVAGLLVGGAGTVISTSSAAAPAGPIADNQFDASGLTAADRAAVGDKASRGNDRTTTAAAGSAGSTGQTTQSGTSTKAVGTARVIDMGTCDASYYDAGQQTADGEQFNPSGLTAAHATLPFNTKVRVTNVANGKSVVVRINDRGPYVDDRCLDLSRAAFGSIASLSSGVVDVRYEVLVQEAT
jgi:rare lipoprotein A